MKEIVLRRPRLTSRSVRRGLALVPTVALTAALLGGCLTVQSPSTALVSTTVTCEQASHDATNAKSELDAAQVVIADANTPAAAERDAKVAQAQAKLDRLTAVKNEACKGATSTATATLTPSATATASPTGATCTNWAWSPDAHLGNAWITDGLQSIRDAKTEQDAVKAAQDWMGHVQNDRANLQAAVKMLLDKDVTPAELGNEVCASDLAEQYAIQAYMFLGQSRITPAQAPANGVNSGIVDGQPRSSDSNEIHGDLTAIKIEYYEAGKLVKTVWVMARCGNGVTLIQIFLPGPTDNNVQVCESGPDQGQPVGDDGTCQKDAAQDPQSRVQVPVPVVKTGRSVDNGSEISGGPVAPVDSGNGVPEGSAPRSTPAPSPTHAGPGPVLPSPTESPAPLPTPQPTQTASLPPPPPPPA